MQLRTIRLAPLAFAILAAFALVSCNRNSSSPADLHASQSSKASASTAPRTSPPADSPSTLPTASSRHDTHPLPTGAMPPMQAPDFPSTASTHVLFLAPLAPT